MADDWKPQLNREIDLTRLPLSAEDGFVLSRLDGNTAVQSLGALTGFTGLKVSEILARLTSLGAVVPRGPRSEPEPEPEPFEAQEPDSGAEAEAAPEKLAQHRALFETRLHALLADERIARARTCEEPELSAFCFDPLPAVAKAVLENSRAGLLQARLLARHHRNPVGLEAVVAKAAFAADLGVRRGLTRNPQLPASLFRRLFAAQRMRALFQLSQDRDVPEATRRTARELLRTRFTQGPAEERVELILKSEGRCLVGLSGLPIDAKTTALLCGRTYASVTLIQNLARWSAAPPPLIAHLLKQEAVRRQPQLRALLVRHPNAPPELKRA